MSNDISSMPLVYAKTHSSIVRCDTTQHNTTQPQPTPHQAGPGAKQKHPSHRAERATKASHIPHGKNSIDQIILVAHKGQLLLHPAHIRIRQIRAVQVVRKVRQTAKAQDEEV